jgi:hypothetical protein
LARSKLVRSKVLELGNKLELELGSKLELALGNILERVQELGNIREPELVHSKRVLACSKLARVRRSILARSNQFSSCST